MDLDAENILDYLEADMETVQDFFVNASTFDWKVLNQLKECVFLIEAGVYAHEVDMISEAVCLMIRVRRKLNSWIVRCFIGIAFFPGSKVHTGLISYVPRENQLDFAAVATNPPPVILQTEPILELETYCYLVVLIYLIDRKKYAEAKSCASAGISLLKKLNVETIGALAPRFYLYYSLTYELTGDLDEIRRNLFSLYSLATRHHDQLGLETLLNLLVRNFLHYNMYDQAAKLISKAPLIENDQQFCRYLFYLAKIRTIQLQYTDAKSHLLQLVHKPIDAFGFGVQCKKWYIIVHLLLGEIPKRAVFRQKGMGTALRPYFELTKAVRIGDLELFNTVADRFARVFRTDKTNNLVVRLRHNVIRTGLRNICVSYSRISFFDVAKKLRLDSADALSDIGSIIAKAIRDGVIDATLDHANGYMVSKEAPDVYSTDIPKDEFSSRIEVCFDIHNKAVRALRFPPDFFL